MTLDEETRAKLRMVRPSGQLVRLPVTRLSAAELETFGKAFGYVCKQDERGNILFTARREDASREGAGDAPEQ